MHNHFLPVHYYQLTNKKGLFFQEINIALFHEGKMGFYNDTVLVLRLNNEY